MTQKIYAFGYSGKKPQDLHKLALQLDATVFDIRFSPRSRNAQWSGTNLERVLGDRYRHVRAFGNRNYRGGPIELVNFAKGLDEIMKSPRPVILVCVCKDPAICHRTHIGNILRGMDMEVTEIEDNSLPLANQMAFEF